MPTLEELDGRSLADYATDVLRDRLIVLDIPPGTPINDDLIGKELGIGRTPVREAIKRLESEHLVSVYARRGTFASTVDITDLVEISEIRARLEPLAAARAARFATPEQQTRLAELLEALRAADLGHTHTRELMRHDLDVHRAIYAASGNAHLQNVLITYDNLATRIWCLVIGRMPHVEDHVGEHVALLEAVLDGRADDAERIAREHVDGFEHAVRAVI